MRLVILTEDAHGPVTRHRYRAVTPALAAAGFGDVRIEEVRKGIAKRARLFASLGDADLVLLSRKLFSGIETALLRRSAKRLAFDFDDAVCFRDSTRGRPKSLVRRRRFSHVVRSADVVTAGNPYLASLATECGARSVVVAPTPVDTDRYTPGPAPRGGFRVGWIGSRSTRPYLSIAEAAVCAFVRATPGASFAVMADCPPSGFDGVPVEFTRWSEESEVPFLRSLHAGIMPLPDDPWTRGKCGFKLLQSMACGTPVVASPVGVNADIVGAACGRLASSGAEWIGALSALAADPARARAMGAAGRAEAEARWSSAVLGPRFAAALAAAARETDVRG
ncbi:MAG: hypothetical protein HMLKMBBP_02256 [Planctomycetes bacterium]|nr:hypothetical protein [Planctomycetota bacterium]